MVVSHVARSYVDAEVNELVNQELTFQTRKGIRKLLEKADAGTSHNWASSLLKLNVSEVLTLSGHIPLRNSLPRSCQEEHKRHKGHSKI